MELLQTPYTAPSSMLPMETTENRDNAAVKEALLEHPGTERREKTSDGERKTGKEGGVEESAAAVIAGSSVGGDGINRYYCKPPDWALSLCVT